jgi:predicted amidohydrolase
VGEASLTICPAVCYDLRFPELFRRGLQQGAEMFVLGANWPSARQHHWRTLLIARAIENQAFVIGVNRCGSDPHLDYSGGSMALGPKGEILAELGDEERIESVEIDPEKLRSWRGEFPAWRDARLG